MRHRWVYGTLWKISSLFVGNYTRTTTDFRKQGRMKNEERNRFNIPLWKIPKIVFTAPRVSIERSVYGWEGFGTQFWTKVSQKSGVVTRRCKGMVNSCMRLGHQVCKRWVTINGYNFSIGI